MSRLSASRWFVLVLFSALSGGSSLLWLATHLDGIFPVDGWFPGIFADFKSFWLAGRLLAEDRLAVLFDPVAFNFERQTVFPFDHGHVWSYPLHVLLLARPLSLLSYPVAAMLWIAAGALALAAIVRAQGRHWPAALLVTVFSGATFFWFYLGQLSPFTTLLLVAAVSAGPSRPVLAGLCLGFLSIKPQLAAPVAVLMLLGGSWRPLVVAALTTAALVALTTLMIGIEPWVALLRDAAPVQREVMFHWRPVQPLISTPYAAATFAREAPTVAWAWQACLSLPALAALFWVARSRLAWEEKARFAIVATVAGLPYVLVYDHVLLFPALLPLLLDPRTPFPAFAVVVAALILQSFGVLVLVVTGLPFNALLMAALLLVAMLRVHGLLRAGRVARVPVATHVEAAA